MIRTIKKILRPIKEAYLTSAGRISFWWSRLVSRCLGQNRRTSESASWVILCVKKTVYANLVRDNVNSLHRYNRNHRFTIVCDDSCFAALKKKRFDYPNRVRILNHYGNDPRPWQFLKIETLKFACLEESILVDADTIWWEDPSIKKDKILFQVANKRYFDWPQEAQMLQDLFGNDANEGAVHFVTGFVRLPPSYWNERLERRIAEIAEKIWNYPGHESIDPQRLSGLKRLCEEIAIGYAVQEVFPEHVDTLKSSDPYNDRNVMQSLYYGAIHRI